MSMLKKMAEQAKQMKALITLVGVVITVFLWMITNFTPAEAFNKHVSDMEMQSLMAQRWTASQQLAQCTRDIEDYGSLSITGTRACQDAEEHYNYTTQLLCTKHRMFCRE